MSTTATKTPDNYFWIMSENRFMYAPTRSLFEKSAVVKQLGKEDATLVEDTRVCSNLCWIPGAGTFVADMAVNEGELEPFAGNNLFNLYKPPKPLREDADPAKAQFWLDIGYTIYPDDFDHILDCIAFKVQNPGEKINHCIVLGSPMQGIGKDAILWATKRAVGRANWRSKGATAVLTAIEKNFTPFLKSTILQISEVHEMGDKRFGFYDSIKDWCASPPDMLTVADKNIREHPITNAVLPILTTNHLTDGLFIPPEDRRVYLAWSRAQPTKFSKEFWDAYFLRLKGGDDEHVAAFLQARDLSKFSPGEPPIKTEAWKQAVAANRAPADAELSDLLDAMADDWAFETGELGCARPFAVTLDQMHRHPRATHALRLLFGDRGKARTAAHRLATAQFGSFDNPDRADGLWKINGRAQTVYAWAELSPGEKMNAVAELIRIVTLPNKVRTDAELVKEEFE